MKSKQIVYIVFKSFPYGGEVIKGVYDTESDASEICNKHASDWRYEEYEVTQHNP